MNMPTQSHVNLFHPSLSKFTADFIIAARGFLPKIFPDAKTPAIIIETIVGLIFIKNSSSKNIVKPPKRTTATHPAAAIIGIFLNQYISNITLKFLFVGMTKKSRAHIIAILESVRFISRMELILDLLIHKKAVNESIIDETFSLLEKFPSDLYLEVIRALSIPLLSFLIFIEK